MPKGAGYISLAINREDGSLHARSESFQPIPAGISAQPKTLTKDLVSDILTLKDIAWQLGIDPAEFAHRLAADATEAQGVKA